MSGNFFNGRFFGGGFFGVVVSDTHDDPELGRKHSKDVAKRNAERIAAREAMRRTLEQAFNREYGITIEEEIVSAIEPHVEIKAGIDWTEIQQETLRLLQPRIEAYRHEMAEIDDEETLLLLQ